METLNYQPKASARGLPLNTTATIALVYPDISGPFSEIIRGVEIQARKNRYHLLVYCVHGEERSDKLLRLLPAKVDGMILTDHWVDDGYVLDLHR